MSLRKIRPGSLLLFVLLTAFTQIGGVVYLAARWISHAINRLTGLGRLGVSMATLGWFCVLYASVSLFVMPPVATAVGRPPLPCTVHAFQGVAPLSRLVCLLNRHYASEPVHDLLAALAKHMNEKHPGTVVAYLDANFAFFDGFPMLPHLSHDDGHKIDLAFFYEDKQGRYRARAAPSPIGYWAFEHPRPGDPTPCAGRGDLATLRWDMAFLIPLLAQLSLDDARTGEMLQWLAASADKLAIEKILLEPHLTARFGLPKSTVRFQGCRPARHDDHVHVALKQVGG